MPTIYVSETEFTYEEDQVLDFPEGLVGLPQVKRAAVIPMKEFEPFCWLLPLGHEALRFVVVKPSHIFDGYAPFAGGGEEAASSQVYSIVTISSEWERTTFNLKAPIVVDEKTRTARQQILNDNRYQFAESLPLN